MVIPVSAKEEFWGLKIYWKRFLLVAEEIEPRANPAASATGTVLEASVEKGRGIMTTVLVQNGTLKLGDTLLVGENYGRIKAMFDFNGKRIKKAGPSTPVSVSGLNGIPEAGEQFRVVESEKAARKIIAEESVRSTTPGKQTRSTPVSLEEFFSRMQEGESKTLYLIVKADVQGSLEPIVNSLERSGTMMKSTLKSCALRPAMCRRAMSCWRLLRTRSFWASMWMLIPSPRRRRAASRWIFVHYAIIYKLIEDVEKALKGMLAPTYQDVVIGRAEVRQVFRIRNVGTVAGCLYAHGRGAPQCKCPCGSRHPPAAYRPGEQFEAFAGKCT